MENSSPEANTTDLIKAMQIRLEIKTTTAGRSRKSDKGGPITELSQMKPFILKELCRVTPGVNLGCILSFLESRNKNECRKRVEDYGELALK